MLHKFFGQLMACNSMQIAVLEQQKKIADRKVEDEMKAKETDQSIQPATTVEHEMHGNPNMNYTLKKGTGVTLLFSYIWLLFSLLKV